MERVYCCDYPMVGNVAGRGAEQFKCPVSGRVAENKGGLLCKPSDRQVCAMKFAERAGPNRIDLLTLKNDPGDPGSDSSNTFEETRQY